MIFTSKRFVLGKVLSLNTKRIRCNHGKEDGCKCRLKTPPMTPLFPSLEMEADVGTGSAQWMVQREIPLLQPIRTSRVLNCIGLPKNRKLLIHFCFKSIAGFTYIMLNIHYNYNVSALSNVLNNLTLSNIGYINYIGICYSRFFFIVMVMANHAKLP